MSLPTPSIIVLFLTVLLYFTIYNMVLNAVFPPSPYLSFFFFFNDPAPPEISPLPLPDALPILADDLIAGHRPAALRQPQHHVVDALHADAVLAGGLVGPAPRASDAQQVGVGVLPIRRLALLDRKSTRLNSSHQIISYAVFCLKK